MITDRHLAAADPAVADHLVAGVPVLPAAAQIDVVLTACAATRPGDRWWLDRVTFLAPLRVTAAGAEIRTEVADDGTCTVSSREPGGEHWTLHGRAGATGGSLTLPHYLDTAQLRAGCTDAVSGAEIDRWRAASGIQYGPTYRAIRTAHRGADVLLAMLRGDKPGGDGPGGAHFVPPWLLDGVFQCLGMLDGGAAGGCLPWFVGRVAARRPISGTVLARVELTPTDGAVGGSGATGNGVVRGRATVCSLQGEVLLEVERITLKAPARASSAGAVDRALPPVPAQPVPASSVPISAAGSVTAPGWRPTTPAGPPDGEDDGARTMLVVSDEIDGATRTASVHDGTLAAALEHDRPDRVVYVPGPDDGTAGSATAAVQTAFALVRCLAAHPPMVDLTVVTRGAHLVGAHPVGAHPVGGGRVQPSHTALWGLARSLRVENPRTTIRLVDLGPDAAAAAALDTRAHPDPELARRDDTWFTPDLPAPTTPGTPLRVAGGRFLVTGGMGGIGLHVAEMLAADGCSHLTLVGRTEPADGERRARIDRLTDRCEVRIVTSDVRDLAAALQGAERYDGVFHSAGVLGDGLARTLTSERIDEVLAPKIGGAHALDAAFPPDRRPGAVVLFSSISAVHGNLGQSSYSAANAYVDGFAAARRTDGEAWFSLGWGLWNVGMGEQIVQGAAARGIPALSAAEGIALLRAGLALPPAHYVLSAAHRPKDEPMTTVAPEGRLWPSLCSILQTTLHVQRVGPGDNLLELGLDSMMAVEVAAALARDGLDVDPATFFEYAQVDALLAHLGTLSRSAPDEPAPADPFPAPRGAAADDRPVLPPVPAPPGRPVQQPVAVAAAPGTFVPDWNQFRNLDAPRPAASHPVPSAAAPEALLAVPPQPMVPPPDPVRPSPMPPAPAPPAPGRPAPVPSGLPGPTGSPTPRRTLPGRLTDRPQGTFLDRRIDALSAEDRTVVAQDDYFYEPVIEQAHGSWIKFDGRWFLNFASYSYLGLIGHDYIDTQTVRAVERHGTGAHGVRLLAGTLHLHRELELALARFLGTEDAIVYSSGYMANVATVGALVGPGDVVIGDVYNHASILDGYRLSGARVIIYAHNDLGDLERALRKVGEAGRLVVTDAVFSMDGDVAPLPGIVELCERYDAPLMVDEAHSLGVLGATGRGITEHFGIDPARVAVKMGTLSKAVPSAGGYVAGSADLVFALKNNARGWMFSAAATPAQVAAAKAAVDVITAAPGMVVELRRRTERYRGLLHGLGFDNLASETPVVPVICRSAEQAQAMARLCQEDGLFVQPIVYPAVPRALPRLRTIVNLSHSDDDIDRAVATIEQAGRRVGLIG